MKIAYFTESLPPKTDGVAHTYTKLVETLTDRKIDFRFYSPIVPEDTPFWSGKVRGVSSVAFPLYDYYRVGIPDCEELSRELNDFQPDLIQCAAPTPLGIFAVNYAKANYIPAVASYHTNFVSYFKYYGWQLAENIGWAYLRWFHNKFQMNYVPTNSTKNELLEHSIENLDLWQRGIEVGRFSPKMRSQALRESIGAGNLPIILFVGRLVREKDLADLADAASLLKGCGVEHKVVFIGEGPMGDELKERLPGAHFPGFQHGEQLATWFASADIFAFPSTTETFGNVIQEASASGVPTVCVNRGGVVDLVDDGETGFIAEANNPEDFASKLRFLVDHPEVRQRMGATARQQVRQNTWDNINGRLLDSYQQVIHRYRGLHALKRAA
jgi:glycosyltransferase involved in cell wall biosynthesis